MALSIYKEQMDPSYEMNFYVVNVAKESVANTRFGKYTSGQTVKRARLDMSGVSMLPTVIGAASTIQSISDSSELLTIDQDFEALVHIHDTEEALAGELNPSVEAGKQLGMKAANLVDGKVFSEVKNALTKFDNGSLTTGVASGTPITLDATTVPQLVSQAPAVIQAQNVALTDAVLVVDPFHASAMQQYLMGKNIDLAGFTFKNGLSGPIGTAKLYVSNNLERETVLTTTGTFSAAETVVYKGITFTFVSTIGSTPGNVLIGANVAASLANLASAINGTAGAGSTYVEVSEANRDLLRDAGASATAGATTITIYSYNGRAVVTETAANASVTRNITHCYFGQKGAIDLAIRKDVMTDIYRVNDRRATGVSAAVLFGKKTFAGGAKMFVDVWVNN